jgi:hypothetical protein
MTLWFSPRIERLPYSGHVFPLAQTWGDDPVDQSVTIILFLLNIAYVALALWGAIRLWHRVPGVRPVVLFFAAFVILRTAFLTTVEAPEPRYMLVCFPVLIALAAQLFAPLGQYPDSVILRRSDEDRRRISSLESCMLCWLRFFVKHWPWSRYS